MGNKWKSLIERTAGSGEAPYLIFLGELLDLLDPGGRSAFSCKRYRMPDTFGSCDIEWTLFTGRLSVSRRLKRSAGESWPGIDAGADETRITGFPPGEGIVWDGKISGDRGITVRLLGAGEEIEMKAGAAARALFHEVSLSRTMLA